MRGNPDGSLSSRVGFAEALLSFRGIGFSKGLSRRRLGDVWNKDAAEGTSAAPATLVLLQ
jgi:hypothetical protein